MFIRCLMASALFCALAIGAAPSFSADAGKSLPKDAALEQEILKLNAEMGAAECNGGNVATLERLYAPEYTHTHAGALVEKRDDYINDIKTGKRRYAFRDMTDMHVRVYGNTAIINGHIHIKNLNGESQNNFMDVWVKQGGKWRVAAWVTSRLSPPVRGGGNN